MEVIDDFETVATKPKKPTRVPYKKLAAQTEGTDDAPAASGSQTERKPSSRKASDIKETV